MDGRALKNIVLDVFFPIACVGCEGEFFASWLCEDCEKIVLKTAKKENRVVGTKFLDGAYAFFPYKQSIVEKLMLCYKYEYVRSLETVFEKIFSSAFHDEKKLWQGCRVTALPLHERRRRERGFNQSEIFAKTLAAVCDLQYVEGIIERKKYTVPQAELDGEERRENMKDHSIFYARLEAEAGSFIVVDDVMSTGTTLDMAACALKKAGVKKVIGVAFAG